MMNKEEIIKRMDKLRELRNELTDKTQKIQKEIDELDLELRDINQYIGKCIEIDGHYIKVTGVRRMYKGFYAKGPSFKVYPDYIGFSFGNDNEFTVTREDKIKIISEDIWNKLVKDSIETIKTKSLCITQTNTTEN